MKILVVEGRIETLQTSPCELVRLACVWTKRSYFQRPKQWYMDIMWMTSMERKSRKGRFGLRPRRRGRSTADGTNPARYRNRAGICTNFNAGNLKFMHKLPHIYVFCHWIEIWRPQNVSQTVGKQCQFEPLQPIEIVTRSVRYTLLMVD